MRFALDAYKHNKHFIVEKPLAVNKGDLNVAKNLEGLINFEKKNGKNLVIKITAHFAHKPASLALFDNIDRLIDKHGKITKFEGFYEEIDDPLKPRTIATLNLHSSGGGIFIDTGCHLETIISALGGRVTSTQSFEWDSYKGYGVETYGKVTHTVEGEKFSNNSIAEITVAKFINEYKSPQNEKKELKKNSIKHAMVIMLFRLEGLAKTDFLSPNSRKKLFDYLKEKFEKEGLDSVNIRELIRECINVIK